MKKIVTMSLVAVAALSIGACTPKAADNTTTIENEVSVNETIVDDSNLTTVDENATENVSNAM